MKAADEILDGNSGWQGFDGLVMDGNFSCYDIAVKSMKQYATQVAEAVKEACQQQAIDPTGIEFGVRIDEFIK